LITSLLIRMETGLKVGNKIKKLRELKNYSQEYMADKLGISQAQFSKIERDESDMNISRLKEISDILEMRIEDVLTFDERYVFNAYDHGQAAVNIYNQQASEQIQKLYEDKIKLLEEIIRLKDQIINK
jgi:transcriptional regulator with XRE-family HTH domain